MRTPSRTWLPQRLTLLWVAAAAAFALRVEAAVSNPSVALAPVVEVAAFGVAPVSGVPESAQLKPRLGDIVHRVDSFGIRVETQGEVEIRSVAGEDWSDLLARISSRLDDGTLVATTAEAPLHLLPPLLAGKYVRLRTVPEKAAVQIDYVVRAEEIYAILVAREGVQVTRVASDPRVVERMRSDASKASLFTATDAIGLPESIALQLADIFSDQVDFHRELHLGYRCVLVYEVLYRDGHIAGPARILAAELEIRSRRLQAFYYSDAHGRTGYFNEAGASLERFFRKSPVEFSRMSSAYTLARFHPILGLWRAHRGTDYAAPVGTKVLATADGTVDFAGARGEFGNLLILNHSGKFLTYYGHLNGFASGLTPGAKVEKGQTIGFVGMTGLATGPHLHYEFRVNNAGQWVSVPPPEVIHGAPLLDDAYFQTVRAYQGQFQVAQRTHLVILD